MKKWLISIIAFGVSVYVLYLGCTSKPSVEQTSQSKIVGVDKWLNFLCEGQIDLLDDDDFEIYLADSLVALTIKQITLENTDVYYNVEVKLTPYEKLESLDLDNEVIYKLKDDYINKELSDSELESRLLKIYSTEKVKNCYKKGDASKTITLVLEDSRESKVDFINALLEESNILGNIKYYEDNIKYALDSRLEE